jgi:signal peptidase I
VPRRDRPLLTWRRVLRDGALLYLAVLVLRAGLVDVYAVPSGSMRPTLVAGDTVAVDRLAYGPTVAIPGLDAATAAARAWDRPARGDVIVFRHPRQPGVTMVKRVVGLAGERIAADGGGRLAIDGAVVPLTPIDPAAGLWRQCLAPDRCMAVRAGVADGTAPPAVEPVTVAAGHLFVLGDDRRGSIDSRAGWQVPVGTVLGRVRAVAWSHDPAATDDPIAWLRQWRPGRTLARVE